ncbi:TKL/TKL-ccin protein kinase [Coprinopsis cinerea AmutBmut pab1-1]|nr:TKL/TKL-ccin protein kinase [Coprinopsis cinerea AmutBmut pab1-1]
MPTKSRKWFRQRRPTDAIMKDGRDTDFIVAIMGPTGVGKSTFLNKIAGKEVTTVGHDLASCTQQLHPYIMDHPSLPGQRLVLVDTPGFDDTLIDDAEILRRIAVWLASSYDSDMKLGGILYLYDISAKRLTGSVRLNMKMFRKLCGREAYDKVIICTTKWTKKNEEQAAANQEELKRDFWKDLIDNGTRVMRVDNTESSYRKALDALLEPVPNQPRDPNPTPRSKGKGSRAKGSAERVLRIQEELVLEEKLVPRTEAGKLLKFSLSEMLVIKQKELACAKDPQTRAKLQEDVDFLSHQLEDLHASFFKRWFYRLWPL